jgi:hypothetical protein
MAHRPRIEKVVDSLFEGEETVPHLIELIVAPLGLRVDGSSPWADARLQTVCGADLLAPRFLFRSARRVRQFLEPSGLETRKLGRVGNPVRICATRGVRAEEADDTQARLEHRLSFHRGEARSQLSELRDRAIL